MPFVISIHALYSTLTNSRFQRKNSKAEISFEKEKWLSFVDRRRDYLKGKKRLMGGVRNAGIFESRIVGETRDELFDTLSPESNSLRIVGSLEVFLPVIFHKIQSYRSVASAFITSREFSNVLSIYSDKVEHYRYTLQVNTSLRKGILT